MGAAVLAMDPFYSYALPVLKVITHSESWPLSMQGDSYKVISRAGTSGNTKLPVREEGNQA
jgi:hypothetical protein